MRDTEREREREREREAETQAEGEAGSMQGARRGMWDSISGLQDHAPAEGDAKPLSHPGCPQLFNARILIPKLYKNCTRKQQNPSKTLKNRKIYHI